MQGTSVPRFSSEENAEAWVKEPPELDSDIITMEQGIILATANHGSKLDYDWEAFMHQGEKMAKIGPDRDFWKV